MGTIPIWGPTELVPKLERHSKRGPHIGTGIPESVWLGICQYSKSGSPRITMGTIPIWGPTWASRRYPSTIFAIFFDYGCYFRSPGYGFSGQIPFIFTIASISPLIGRFLTQKLGTRPIISQLARLMKGFFRFRLQAH
jgi:hypothetical protein